ncbi:undecaprenyl/decaprenyl-phosphate alpha-N-acetylglucosaminyl 1-phosphate transferase [Paenibacillus antri]|uniref:Undecaprenyl/decaprenyl-phosphate alpha-N-acetylglucosaminyl 1-phosphate transferase n=1 Tax=Paenibacillus antri TaxID=2582848 RepID=A0A5R9G469_9BACL|nr:MraY family glycosyltransferase [Paenibacillus antri]TLS50551.1 undecaprenyl/decaprenyl-phosphate alpha-N-acetylglucosaminyl 1-phosphate transferase [Paenibacillus antri]
MEIAYIVGFVVALAMALGLTPLVKKFAVRVGAVDAPNQRKVHTRIMPRLGGLAIYLAFMAAIMIALPLVSGEKPHVIWGLLLGGTIVTIVGALDDRFDLSPKVKLLGQIAAASVVVSFGVKVDFVTLPFGDGTQMGWLSIPITIFWIVGVTNAINLIDGLDGLAAGVSAIATGTIFVLALIMGNITVAVLSAVLLGSILGFLFFNFHPAKIFMGDSGALFLGFSLAALSVLGFKQATLVSFVVPIFILGVPLSDTFFAIVRRTLNKTPISAADKNHLHHCILALGLSHRNSVLVIYAIAAMFALSAILLSTVAQWVALIVIAVTLLVLQVGAELIGIVQKGRRPVINFVQRLLSLK